MQITFLGHQGWAFGDQDGIVLLDPLLQSMSAGPVDLPVWPARRLEFSAMPKIAGLVISHEHPDHFDIETLINLPYRGDVWIPDLSTSALATCLRELGFTVRRYGPFQSFTPGAGVEFTPLAPDFFKTEVDVYGLLVRREEKSFLTMIDTWPSPITFAWLEEHCPRRTLDNFTNNSVVRSRYLSVDRTEPAAIREKAIASTLESAVTWVDGFSPTRVAISGQGWSFPAPHAHFDLLTIASTHDDIAPPLRKQFPDVAWFIPLPGQSFDTATEEWSTEIASFVKPLPCAPRSFDPASVGVPEFRPWGDSKVMSERDRERVSTFIETDFGRRLAAHADGVIGGLYQLHALPDLELDARLFLRVRDGARWTDYAFDLSEYRFRPVDVDRNPVEGFAIGLDLWGTDLVTLLDGECVPWMVYDTAARFWNHLPEAFPPVMLFEVFDWFTPRFRTDVHLQYYRSVVRRFRAAASHPETLEER